MSQDLRPHRARRRAAGRRDAALGRRGVVRARARPTPPAGCARPSIARAISPTPTPRCAPRLDALRHAAPGAVRRRRSPGPSAAQAWLGPLAPALREAFQRDWASRVEDAWKARHEQARKQRVRLRRAARAARAGRRPGAGDAAPGACAWSPRSTSATRWRRSTPPTRITREGCSSKRCERLERDDASGLPLLEAAMKLDPDATKPACQRAHAFLLERGDKAGAEACAAALARRATRTRRCATAGAHHQHRARARAARPRRRARWRKGARAATPAATQHVDAIHLARRVIPADPSARPAGDGRAADLVGTPAQAARHGGPAHRGRRCSRCR